MTSRNRVLMVAASVDAASKTCLTRDEFRTAPIWNPLTSRITNRVGGGDVKRSFVAGAIGILLLSVTLAPKATADSFGECLNGQNPCLPDDATHIWCFGESTLGPDREAMRGSIRYAIDTMDAQTQMVDYQTSACSSTTDVRWLDGGNLTIDVLGQANCTSSTGRECNATNIRIHMDSHYWWANRRDDSFLTDGNEEPGEIDLNRDMTACHELGHTIGFVHHHDLSWYDTHDNDCMRSPWLEAELANNGWRNYNGHHIDHINNYV